MLMQRAVLSLVFSCSIALAEHDGPSRQRPRENAFSLVSTSSNVFEEAFEEGKRPGLMEIPSSDWIGKCRMEDGKKQFLRLHVFEKEEFKDVKNRFTRSQIDERMFSFKWEENNVSDSRKEARDSIARFGSTNVRVDKEQVHKDDSLHLSGGIWTSGGMGTGYDYLLRTNKEGDEMYIKMIYTHSDMNRNKTTYERYCILQKQ